jgi:hypothetical protein
MSAIKATMTAAAIATMATVDAAMTMRGSFPATWSRNLGGKRLALVAGAGALRGARPSFRGPTGQPRSHSLLASIAAWDAG